MNKKLFKTCLILIVIICQFTLLKGASKSKLKTYDGYTLFSPLNETTTYLINMDGDIVHTWQSDYSPACSIYFLDNSHIIRTATMGARGGMRGSIGGGQRRGGQGAGGGGYGAGGRIQEVDWDGNLIWDFEYHTDREMPHHDIERMPNGNVLILCWDMKTPEENIAVGRKPEYQTSSLYPDCIIEVKPTGKTTGKVVWKWYLWDHLIQDFDPNKPNYGKVSEHPELVDLNYSERWADQSTRGAGQGNRRGGGGFGGFGAMGGMPGGGGLGGTNDWTHSNSIDYNQDFDQIIINTPTFCEFWIIDHSTTIEEAASHKGGKYNKGGDLLYRWGNPAAYKCGTKADQKLFSQHNAYWIEKGFPGAGHILVFNNGSNRQDGRYSSVDEIVLPVAENGNYKMEGKTFGPKEPVWSYTDQDNKANFYVSYVSGAQRLPNGNTLICEGPRGYFFEVTHDKKIVWEYQFSASGGAGGGAGGGMMGGFGGGFNMGSQIFRAYRIPADHPALKDKGLVLRKNESEK